MIAPFNKAARQCANTPGPANSREELTGMKATGALLTITAALALAAAAQADPLPSIYGPNAGPLELPDGSTHPQRGGWMWVQQDPVVHLVFWGPAWTHDTTGIVAAEFALFHELQGSAYNGLLEQYGVHNDVRLQGAFFDSQPPQGRLTYDSLAREADRARRLHHWRNDAYAQYVVLPQFGADMRNFAGECGEHDDLTLGKRTYYVDLIPPYQDALYSIPGDSCVYDYSSDNGKRAPGLVDATTSITSHEYAEAATNPWGSTHEMLGWYDFADSAEVADLCAWYSAVPNGMTVNVSYLWSNSANGCVVGG